MTDIVDIFAKCIGNRCTCCPRNINPNCAACADYNAGSVSIPKGLAKEVLALLKEQEQKIKELESMRVSASGNAVAIGVVRGGLKITR